MDYSQKWFEVLNEALETAKFFGYSSVTPGCILVGLTRVQGTVAETLLRRKGVDLEAVLSEIPGLEDSCGDRDSHTVDMPYTGSAISVVQLAEKTGEEMQHLYRGPEHLLCGLARSEDRVVKRLLYRLGVRGERLYRKISSLLCVEPEAVA